MPRRKQFALFQKDFSKPYMGGSALNDSEFDNLMQTNDQFKHVEEYEHILTGRKGGHGPYAGERDQMSDDLPHNSSFEEARDLRKRDHDPQANYGILRVDSEQSLRNKNIILNNMTPQVKQSDQFERIEEEIIEAGKSGLKYDKEHDSKFRKQQTLNYKK